MKDLFKLFNETFKWPDGVVSIEEDLQGSSLIKVFEKNNEELLKEIEGIPIFEDMHTFTQFSKFAKIFTNKFTNFLTTHGCTNIKILTKYFYVEGYFTSKNNKMFYFRFTDVRTTQLKEIIFKELNSLKETRILTYNFNDFVNEFILLNNNIII